MYTEPCAHVCLQMWWLLRWIVNACTCTCIYTWTCLFRTHVHSFLPSVMYYGSKKKTQTSFITPTCLQYLQALLSAGDAASQRLESGLWHEWEVKAAPKPSHCLRTRPHTLPALPPLGPKLPPGRISLRNRLKNQIWPPREKGTSRERVPAPGLILMSLHPK